MDLNYEILQYFAYKRVIRHRQIKEIFDDCTRLHMHAESYLVIKGYCTQVTSLAAMGEFFCLPYCEMDMLEVDRSLLEKVTFGFLRKHKFVPVSLDKNGKMLLAVARPLDLCAMSMISQVHVGPIDCILVPAVQIDVFIDSIVAVRSTTTALEDLQRVKDRQMADAARLQYFFHDGGGVVGDDAFLRFLARQAPHAEAQVLAFQADVLHFVSGLGRAAGKGFSQGVGVAPAAQAG